MRSRINEAESGLSEKLLRSKAVSLFGQTNPERPAPSDLYGYLKDQANVAFSKVPLPEGVSERYGFDGTIPVSYTGFVTARSPDAFIDLSYCSARERDLYSRLTLERNMRFLDREMLYVETSLGRGNGWSAKVGILLPKAFAKHGLDAVVNNFPAGEGDPDIMIVVDPTWVNPAWERSWSETWNIAQIKENAPPRGLMIFDRENYVAYLCGAMYFGELKKAMLRLGWHMLKVKGIGAPLHASSKEMRIVDVDGKLSTTSFAIIGLSGTGKSTLSMHSYPERLDPEAGEFVRIGHDDSLAIIFTPEDRSTGLIGLEDNLYNKTDDYAEEGSIYPGTVVTAENNMITPDGQLVYGDTYSPNGRCESLRTGLPIADESPNAPWPDYLIIIQKNETMPPVMLLEDPLQISAYYMSVQTRPSSAENIPFSQMGRLKMVPGANPFICGPMDWEAQCILRGLRATGAKALVLNTDNYLGYDIPKETSLDILLQVARNSVEWTDSDIYDGKVPVKGCIDIEDFDDKYGRIPMDMSVFMEKYTMRVGQKLEFLKGLGVDEIFIDSIS